MAKNLAIERQAAARFAVYVCNLDDEPCQRVAEYDSVPEVLARKRRFDQVIKVQVGHSRRTQPPAAPSAVRGRRAATLPRRARR
jgi:hypothetical protein